jgi:hypothetical protein
MAWLSPFTRVRSRRGRPAPRPRYRPALEGLEERTLLTGTPPSIFLHAPLVAGLSGEGFSAIPPTGTGPAELNPYGVAFVPQGFPTTGTLQPGDLLVANFNDPANAQGTGTTIVRVTPQGQRSTFFTSTALGLDTGLVVLKSGFVVVANVPAAAGGTIAQGSLQVIDSNGNLVKTLTDANLLKDPWDLAVNDKGSTAQLFVSNVSGTTGPNGTVTRVDLTTPTGVTPTVTDMVQIAGGYRTRLDPAAFVVGPAGLAYDAGTDTLYVASQAEMVGGAEVGTIFAVAHASTATTSSTEGTVVFADATHLHGPIGLALAPNGDLITANSDAVNTDPTQPSELVEFTPAGQFVKQFAVDPLNAGAFGLAVNPTGGGFQLAAVDDNQNTVTLFSGFPTFANPYVVSTIPPTGPAELNPYGVAFVPQGFPTTGTLQPGDLLVANFNDPTNAQGTGTTIVRVTPQGQRSTFFTSTALGLDTGLVVLKSGFVVVANVPAGPLGTVGQGSLQVIDSNGNLVKTITDQTLLKDPWDLAVDDGGPQALNGGNQAQLFVSNVSDTPGANGTVTRVDLQIQGGTVTVADMVQIASGYRTRLDPAAFVVGPGGLAYNPQTDTLYVASQAEMVGGAEVGTVFAVAHAGATAADHGTGTVVYADAAHLHGPIGLALAPNGDLITANSDAVNTDSNQPSELVEFTPAGQFVKQFAVDPLNAGAFGVAVNSSGGQIQLAAVNDNQNTVSVWTFALANPLAAAATQPTVSVTEGTAAVVPVAAFTDAAPPADTSGFTATIDWGDGTTTPGTVTAGAGNTFTVSGSHAYADEGSFTAHVTLNDLPDPDSLTVTNAVTVKDADKLTAGPAGLTTVLGQSFSGAVATFQDAGYPANALGDLTATISWGDGLTSNGTVLAGSNGSFTVMGSHTYTVLLLVAQSPQLIMAPLSVTLTDGSPGTASATATGTAVVTVVLAPPAGMMLSSTTALTVRKVSGKVFDLVATVTGQPGQTPTGVVVFLDGNTFLGTARLVNGVATLRKRLGHGKHHLVAMYGGDSFYLTSMATASVKVR